MQRFMIFYFPTARYSLVSATILGPGGGMSDFRGSFPKREDALGHITKLIEEEEPYKGYEWQLLDQETGEFKYVRNRKPEEKDR